MLPDISSPAGFLVGLLGLVCVIFLVYAFYRSFRSGSIRSSGTDKLSHELGRIATALESMVLQRQEANKGEPHPHAPLEQPTPVDIPNPVHRPDEKKQEEPKGESKSSGTIPLSMFGRGR